VLGGNVDGLSGLGRDAHAVVGERLLRADESAPSAARPRAGADEAPGLAGDSGGGAGLELDAGGAVFGETERVGFVLIFDENLALEYVHLAVPGPGAHVPLGADIGDRGAGCFNREAARRGGNVGAGVARGSQSVVALRSSKREGDSSTSTTPQG